MIYIWDNGGDYSDHGIYFLETAHRFEDVESFLPRCGEGFLIGAAERVEWRDSGPACLAATASSDQFFQLSRDPSPDPHAERPYIGGLYNRDEDNVASGRRAWEAGKYKQPWSVRGFLTACAFNPASEMFEKLTPAVAEELCRDWAEAKDRFAEFFIAECRERGLIK